MQAKSIGEIELSATATALELVVRSRFFFDWLNCPKWAALKNQKAKSANSIQVTDEDALDQFDSLIKSLTKQWTANSTSQSLPKGSGTQAKNKNLTTNVLKTSSS